MSEMRIAFKYDSLLPIKELKASKHQRNKHPKEQIERLAKIMLAHGVRHPIHISKLSGQVCFGHGRWEAAKLNKWTHFPVVYQDFKDEDEEYACVQSDNAIAHWAELDLSLINIDLQNLGPDFDIDLLGIKDFVLEPAEKFEAQCDEDEVPQSAETRCKRGDVWTLGRHRLICGDSSDAEVFNKLIGDTKADLIHIDPPYGKLKIFNKAGQVGKDNVAKAKKYGAYANEGTYRIEPLLALIEGKYEKLIIWGGNYFADVLPITTSWLCWDKRAGEHSWFSDFELAWSNLGTPARLFKHVWQGMIREGESDDRVHPTQKPIALAEWSIKEWTKENAIVFDFFGGSGWTLIACEKTGRQCFMTEISEHYCDVILARWEKYTGQKAERLDEGKEKDRPTSKGNKRAASKKSGRNKLQLRRNGGSARL